jgi:hypothetical protein
MIKYIFIFLPFLFLFSCTGNKPKTGIKNLNNDLAKWHFSGRVKMVCTATYSANLVAGDIIKEGLMSIDSEKYNTAGFYTEQSTYSRGTTLNHQKIFTYDIHNNIVEEKNYELNLYDHTQPMDSAVIKDYVYTYVYDSRGNILEKKETINGKAGDRIKNERDTDGIGSVTKTFNAEDSLYKIETSKYDKHGRVIEVDKADAYGVLLQKYFTVYDKKGNQLQTSIYKGDGTMQMKDDLKYDENDNEIEHIIYESPERASFDWKYVNTRFDSEGNWLNQQFYDRGHLLWVKERTIEYY